MTRGRQNTIFTFFHQLPRNVAWCFWGRNLLWQLAAIGLTYVSVTSGFDWAWFAFFRPTVVYWLAFVAGPVGALVPIFAPVILYAIGQQRKNERLANTSCALGQAAFIGWGISSLYKAFTGRLPPQLPTLPPNQDVSHFFDFGFFQQGIFWGWPSSHTTVAFAMAVAFVLLYPHFKKLKYWSFAYAAIIGLGASVSFHWFSDVAAGVILGSIIGTVVGNSFLRRHSDEIPIAR